MSELEPLGAGDLSASELRRFGAWLVIEFGGWSMAKTWELFLGHDAEAQYDLIAKWRAEGGDQ